MKYSKFAAILALTVAASGAWAKLPPLTDEQKAKAEEAKAAAAERAKVEAEQLANAQNRVAEAFIKQQKAKGIIVTPTPIVPPAQAAAAPAAAPVASAKK
jgi:hypothetical protein